MTVSSTIPGVLYFHIFLGILSKNVSKNGIRFLHILNNFFSTVWTVDTKYISYKAQQSCSNAYDEDKLKPLKSTLKFLQ